MYVPSTRKHEPTPPGARLQHSGGVRDVRGGASFMSSCVADLDVSIRKANSIESVYADNPIDKQYCALVLDSKRVYQ